MLKDNSQKVKLLKIYEMLRHEATEDEPLTTAMIIQRLGKMGIGCDRRTLSRDMAALRQYGFDIGDKMISHEKGYYVIEKNFSAGELKIIIDALQAASFVTKEKSDDLIGKVASLGGSRREDILKSSIICFNTKKHSNDAIYDTVEMLEEAVRNHKKASFYYFDLDEKQNRVYRKEKKRYVVDPVALIYNDDNYYLMCYSQKYSQINNYRLDRMDEVAIEEEDVCQEAMLGESDISDYRTQVFRMYGGEKQDVTVEFNDKLISVIQDKFGEDISIIRTGDNKCVASIQVQVSPTFWGWLFQFVGEMKIISPEPLMELYRERAAQVQKM